MKKNSICLFYNDNKGYGIVAFVPQRGGSHTSCEPMVKLNKEASIDELINAIEYIDKETEDKVLEIGDEGYEYWKDLECNTYSKFVKQFKMISLRKRDKFIIKTNIYSKEARGMVSDKELQLSLNVSNKILTKRMIDLLYNMLSEEKTENEEEIQLQITLLNDRKIHYRSLTDDFLDVDDYGVDAYKIYLYEDDGPSYIGFMIDCGYKAFDKEGITARWNEMYNPNISYKFEELNDKKIKYRVSAESDTCIVESNFIIAGDELVEYLVYIDKDKNINDVDKMMAEYKRVLDSIKIE